MSLRFNQLPNICRGSALIPCEIRAQDERVEATLVDEDRIGIVVRTSVANRDGGFVFVLHMSAHGIASIAILQRHCHILAAEERRLGKQGVNLFRKRQRNVISNQ